MKSIIVFSLFLILGCANQKNTQSFQKANLDNENESIIYVYFSQDGITQGPSLTEFGPNLYLNGQKVGLLAVGTYVPIKLKNGTHTIKTSSGWDNKVFADLSTTIKLEKGESKYIEFVLMAERVDQNNSKWTSAFAERTDVEAYPKISMCKINVSLSAFQAKNNP